MRLKDGLWLLLVGTGIALVACSSDDGDTYPSVDSFCDALATEECKVAAPKCATVTDACKADRVSICHTTAGAAATQGRAYKASAADACISKTHDMYAQPVITADGEKAQIDACAHVFAGTKQKADACTAAAECVTPLVCTGNACADEVIKKTGDPCNNPGDTCDTGLFCALKDGSTSKFCVAKHAVSQGCDVSTPCLEDLRCSSGTAAGVCLTKVNSGEACTASTDCAATAPFCDPALKKCSAKQVGGDNGCKDFGG